jgi:hypothetical protein
MDFLFINTNELSALMELPLIQRVAYLMGIRPYMDKQTCMVGIKRKISYQSLREILYVAPIAGVKTENPSQQQIRRVIKSLERAGLIAIQSTEKQLILKCILAAEDRSVQSKADMRPTPQADIRHVGCSEIKSNTYKSTHRQDDKVKVTQADIPHNSEDHCVFLCKQFEKFWEMYPKQQNKAQAWSEFKKLNPDEDLFSKILGALDTQLNHYQQQQAAGIWMPNWKYPANWLAQRGWEDEINTKVAQEKVNATHQSNFTKQPIDFFWESCKSGADYAPECEGDTNKTAKVIEFRKHRTASETY